MPEQALDGIHPGLGLVVKDKPCELISCVCVYKTYGNQIFSYMAIRFLSSTGNAACS